MTDEELLHRLSSDNSQLKVIIARTKHHNLMVYAMNNVLIEQNERLKQENKDLESAIKKWSTMTTNVLNYERRKLAL